MTDAYIEEMRLSRDGSSVLKMDLMNLRSDFPDGLIFVFEGIGDKGVYFNWCARINPELTYEPFVCNGKERVLQLKRSLDSDLNGLARDVYFFVDRDFNDLNGVAQDDSIFMTRAYAIENYLVSSKVLDELLKVELHCHGFPAIRREVVELFEEVYDSFLDLTRDINQELHAARRLGVELKSHLPSKINQLAIVHLDRVELPKAGAAQLSPARKISPDEKSRFEAEFAGLDPRSRYRGKFAMLFFLKWLEQLAIERTSPKSRIFSKLGKGVKIRHAEICLASLASKSVIPAGLRSFLEGISGGPRLAA